MQRCIRIFCCYAPKDRSFLSELKTYLFPLQQQNLITTWSDMDISPGTNLDEQIQTYLNKAHIILILLSPGFLTSDPCYKQMQRAMERHEQGEIRVIPILLQPVVDLQSLPIGKLSMLPSNGEPITWNSSKDILYNIAQGIQKVVEEILTNETAIPISPDEETIREVSASRARHNLPRLSSEFFGREEDIIRVLGALASRSFIICIEGLGGVGKTTLAIQTALYSLSDPNHLFERIIWIDALDRPNQEHWFNDVLDTIARELGSPALMRMPQEQKALEVSTLLIGHAVLIVIDNYEKITDKDLDTWIEKKVPELSKVLIVSSKSDWRNIAAIHLRGMQNAEALTLIRNHCQRWELKALEKATDETLLPLITVTEGNPKAIELAMGHIRRGGLSLEEVIDHLHSANASVTNILEDLHKRSWEKMHTDAQHILMVIPFFADPVKREAIGFAAGFSGFRLRAAVEELVQFMFLEVDQHEPSPIPQYHIHPLTRAFGSTKLNENPEYEQEARQRWYKYYYEIVKKSLIKGQTGDFYWDSLVRSGEAIYIDAEWANIRKVLEWANLEGQDTVLIDFMLLISHYMNRHFYYLERIVYAQYAVEAAERTHRLKEAALFRIDTLGWTLIETNRLLEAEQVIHKGLQIAQSINLHTPEAHELIVLAHVFLARVALQQGKLTEAETFIYAFDTLHCRQVIQFRAAMIAGDIAYRQGKIDTAIKMYEQAQHISGQYGSEGADEDLAYRMARAYLANADLEKAEQSFKNLPNLEKYPTVTTGTIYVKLEEADFAKARGDIEQARRSIQEALNSLSPTTESHWMLDEIRNFLKGLEASQ